MTMWNIHTGHTLDVLSQLQETSVQTVVTSPPYWGLRDYGDGGQQWPEVTFSPMPGLPPLTIPTQTAALGLEPDPWAYVGHMVEVFRAVRRVLRDDGTLWLNLGDSYSSVGSGGNTKTGFNDRYFGTNNGPNKQGADEGLITRRRFDHGLKPKDLCGIPWRVAFALQADGWYLRSDIIWAKPNPMPESITDRPTRAHEYLFLLTKDRRYFYDADAISETSRGGAVFNGSDTYAKTDRNDAGRNDRTIVQKRNARSVWTMTTRPYPGAHFAVFPPDLPERCIKAGTRPGDLVLDPFSGAGTTGMVARRLQRHYTGIEQSDEYAEMSRRRIDADAPLFNR